MAGKNGTTEKQEGMVFTEADVRTLGKLFDKAKTVDEVRQIFIENRDKFGWRTICRTFTQGADKAIARKFK